MSEDFLSRWSRRKLAAKAETPPPPAALPEPPKAVAPPPVPEAAKVETAPAALPAVESLTPESDFAPFMRPDVDGAVRRQALKTLFGDPRFNVMDGLDVYIDDYSKPDPLPEGWLAQMSQMAHLGHYQPPVEAELEAAAAPLEAEQAPPVSEVAEQAPEPGEDRTNPLPPEV